MISSAGPGFPGFDRQIKGGGPLNSRISAIFKEVKSMQNQEFSKIDSFDCLAVLQSCRTFCRRGITRWMMPRGHHPTGDALTLHWTLCIGHSAICIGDSLFCTEDSASSLEHPSLCIERSAFCIGHSAFFSGHSAFCKLCHGDSAVCSLRWRL